MEIHQLLHLRNRSRLEVTREASQEKEVFLTNSTIKVFICGVLVTRFKLKTSLITTVLYSSSRKRRNRPDLTHPLRKMDREDRVEVGRNRVREWMLRTSKAFWIARLGSTAEQLLLTTLLVAFQGKSLPLLLRTAGTRQDHLLWWAKLSPKSKASKTIISIRLPRSSFISLSSKLCSLKRTDILSHGSIFNRKRTQRIWALTEWSSAPRILIKERPLQKIVETKGLEAPLSRNTSSP